MEKNGFGYFKLADFLHKKSEMCEDQLSEFQTCPCKTQKLAHLKRVEMLINTPRYVAKGHMKKKKRYSVKI